MTTSQGYRSQISPRYESDFPQWGAALGQWGYDLEHDDMMDADAYDRRRMERDGWTADCWDGR